VWTADRELRLTSCRGALLERFGLDPERVVGNPVADVFGDGEAITGHRRALAGDAVTFEGLLRDRRYEAHVEPLHATGGRVAGTVGVALDITEQTRAEREYGELVEHATFGIFRATADGRFLAVNPSLGTMLGYETGEEVLGLDLAREVFANPNGWDRLVDQSSSADRIENLEVEWRQRDGGVITGRLSGRPVRDHQARLAGFEVIAEDVTERRALAAQLAQAQKM